jgi:hypothetical protein
MENSIEIIKKGDINRLQYLENNIGLFSNLGVNQSPEITKCVILKDGVENEELTSLSNQLITINRQRDTILKKLMEGAE